MSASFKSFEEAFRGGVSGCRARCVCGIDYYDTYNRGYSWDEGELDELAADPDAKPLNHAVGHVEFEGHVYVDACTCWHERAKKVIGFLNGHAHEIAKFLTLEKARKREAADLSPEVG